jgi:hypothetical protein
LLLIICRLYDIARDHQQAVRRHQGLRIVALLEPPPATGMIREVFNAFSIGKVRRNSSTLASYSAAPGPAGVVSGKTGNFFAAGLPGEKI